MKKMMLKSLSAAILASTLSMTVSAQETTSAVRGVVTDEAGAPVSGAVVKLVNPKTGLAKTVISGNDGSFGIRNLPVGEDYTVVVQAEDYASQRTEDLDLNLGEVAALNFALQSSSNLEEIIVVGSSAISNVVATGPSATFSLEQLQTAPAINRSLTDIIRADARVYVNEADVDGIQCGGKNPRYNSFTVDGVRMNDLFGLNRNGYPTERMPFSYDAISQVAVELAPFDVEYGGFTACNINAVTKSGSNEFSGSFFYDYTDDSLRGDSLEGEDKAQSKFDETRYGINLGGPIIQDKLFFFVAYEQLEGANLFDRGPIDSNAIDKINVTTAQLQDIRDIAIENYLYDPGEIPSSMANEDEKLLLKLDWNISESQRLSVTYNYNDGNNFTESDGDLNEFEFSNHLYERGAELESYIASLYSDWTDKFSTEIRFGYLELNNRQNSVGGNDFGEIQVDVNDVTVYLGGDDSRQSNELNYDVTSFAFKGNYLAGDHTVSFGLERDALSVYNLFVQETETEIRFDGIEEFRNGFANTVIYENAIGTHNPADAAADWGYESNTVYAQDDWQLASNLSIVAGLRYEWYTSSDKPAENPNFVDDYGFSNTETLDGKGLLQPRLGITYDLTESITLRGGVGLFSGGNPNVWLSNSFSNTKMLAVESDGGDHGLENGPTSLFDIEYAGLEATAPEGAGPGWGVPQAMYDDVSRGEGGTGFELNFLDPDFELPSEWKYSLGATLVTASEYVFNADLLISKSQNAAMILRADLEQQGTTVQGYPEYSSERLGAFTLTNSDRRPASVLASLSVSKSHDNGIDWSLAYAYSDSKDTQPMTSAVAFSNYTNRSFFDPQEDRIATSDYNIEHRFTGTFSLRKAYFGEYETKLGLFAQASQGPSFSYTTASRPVYGFTPYLGGDNNLSQPGFGRNTERGSWWAKMDLRVEQELPGIMPEHRSSAFLVIDNFTNFLNDEWGVQREVNFPGNVVLGDREESSIGSSSLYQIRFGVQYDF